jgi:UDP-2,3-diacylglucosamine hydrolase
MRKIFVADAHLRDPRDANYLALVRFFDTLPDDTDTLYLLGDLFEFWVGNAPVYPHYHPAVEALKRVCGRGVRLVYFEGNHDFHLARYFARELKAEVHAAGGVQEIAGKRVYLCHGDQANRADRRYRAWRGVLHSPLAAFLLSLFPCRVKGWAAERLSRRSSGRHDRRRRKWDYAAIIRLFAQDRFAEGCHAVVLGHFHQPLLEREGGVLLALGDWISQYSYGQWLDGEFTLERFSPE